MAKLTHKHIPLFDNEIPISGWLNLGFDGKLLMFGWKKSYFSPRKKNNMFDA